MGDFLGAIDRDDLAALNHDPHVVQHVALAVEQRPSGDHDPSKIRGLGGGYCGIANEPSKQAMHWRVLGGRIADFSSAAAGFISQPSSTVRVP